MAYKQPELLTLTRALVCLAQAVTAVSMVSAAVVFIASVLLRGAGKPLPDFTGKLALMDPQAALIALRIGVIGTLIGAAVLMWLLRELVRIIDSTRLGDPFVPENARRLRLIGWLLLAFNFCVSSTISAAVHGGITFPFVSFSALLTVLLVFILARIFDTGSQMRAELKETV
jgi:hypothetical protein